MSRKHPLCAWCGESLIRSGVATMQVQYTKFPGKPEIGWHVGRETKTCFHDDPAVGELGVRHDIDEPDDVSITKTLVAIHGRGPGRVVANKANKLFGKAGD